MRKKQSIKTSELHGFELRLQFSCDDRWSLQHPRYISHRDVPIRNALQHSFPLCEVTISIPEGLLIEPVFLHHKDRWAIWIVLPRRTDEKDKSFANPTRSSDICRLCHISTRGHAKRSECVVNSFDACAADEKRTWNWANESIASDEVDE
jgi:hypothetical protein